MVTVEFRGSADHKARRSVQCRPGHQKSQRLQNGSKGPSWGGESDRLERTDQQLRCAVYKRAIRRLSGAKLRRIGVRIQKLTSE
jgi:hypothetical protein